MEGSPGIEDIRKAAKQRVTRLRAYYAHVFAYLVINVFLLVVNLLTTPDTLWFYWVSIAWGLGLAFDTYDAFWKNRFFGAEWEEKKIQQYMREHPDAKPDEDEAEARKSA